jgi:hypothetical protein
MSFRKHILLIPAALLLTVSLAHAAPPAPNAPTAPQVPGAVAVAQPAAALTGAGATCKSAPLALFSPTPQAAATELCGPCSDDACVGKTPHAVCGSGLRCITGGPTCSTAALFSCKCSII